MDVEARQRFWQLIRTARAEGLCILLATHYLEEAEALADRIRLLKDGHFIADTSPTALKPGLSQRQIRCRSSLPLNVLQQLPGVSAVQHLPNQQVQISSRQSEDFLRQLLQQDTLLCDLTVSAASLEQAFNNSPPQRRRTDAQSLVKLFAAHRAVQNRSGNGFENPGARRVLSCLVWPFRCCFTCCLV